MLTSHLILFFPSFHKRSENFWQIFIFIKLVVAWKRAENNLTVSKHAGNITKENHRRRRTQSTCNLLTGDMWLSLKMLLAALACVHRDKIKEKEGDEGRSEWRNIVVSLKLWYSRPKKCLLLCFHLFSHITQKQRPALIQWACKKRLWLIWLKDLSIDDNAIQINGNLIIINGKLQSILLVIIFE